MYAAPPSARRSSTLSRSCHKVTVRGREPSAHDLKLRRCLRREARMRSLQTSVVSTVLLRPRLGVGLDDGDVDQIEQKFVTGVLRHLAHPGQLDFNQVEHTLIPGS